MGSMPHEGDPDALTERTPLIEGARDDDSVGLDLRVGEDGGPFRARAVGVSSAHLRLAHAGHDDGVVGAMPALPG